MVMWYLIFSCLDIIVIYYRLLDTFLVILVVGFLLSLLLLLLLMLSSFSCSFRAANWPLIWKQVIVKMALMFELRTQPWLVSSLLAELSVCWSGGENLPPTRLLVLGEWRRLMALVCCWWCEEDKTPSQSLRCVAAIWECAHRVLTPSSVISGYFRPVINSARISVAMETRRLPVFLFFFFLLIINSLSFLPLFPFFFISFSFLPLFIQTKNIGAILLANRCRTMWIVLVAKPDTEKSVLPVFMWKVLWLMPCLRRPVCQMFGVYSKLLRPGTRFLFLFVLQFVSPVFLVISVCSEMNLCIL